ncbi:DUF2625 family protein [Streptomyces nojiriensis]|uniref:DUF2625 family protein n=1 Tax=Streptomyces nojiriensis TaxID=66374 RepID=UPI003999B10D
MGEVFALNGGNPPWGRSSRRARRLPLLRPRCARLGGLGRRPLGVLSWIFYGGLREFHQALRWDGWRSEISALNGRQGLSFFPPLRSAEARQDRSATAVAQCP